MKTRFTALSWGFEEAGYARLCKKIRKPAGGHLSVFDSCGAAPWPRTNDSERRAEREPTRHRNTP